MAVERTIAVLGAGGTMGFAMARNLARAGFQIRAWDRSRKKAEPLGEDGAAILDTPAAAADGAGIVLTMLADGDVVIEAVSGDDGALAHAGESTLWVQMSTIGISATERCSSLAEETGVTFVDAPVLGTKAPAEAGELVVLAAGPDQARESCDPVFDAVGKKTLWLGEAGAGTRLKLVTNAWLVAVVEGIAETFAFAEGLGVDPSRFLEAVDGGPLDMGYLQIKGKSLKERNFEPSFKLRLAAKDARLVEEAIEREQLDLPVLRAIRERLEQGVSEHGDEDVVATWWTSAPRSLR
jgi:3-hydroxyisobutyrate dehydrogenase